MLLGRTDDYQRRICLSKACEETNAPFTDFTGAPVFMKENEGGAHEWIFEFSQNPDNLDSFIDAFDQHLKN
jgi:hypothetical protein